MHRTIFSTLSEMHVAVNVGLSSRCPCCMDLVSHQSPLIRRCGRFTEARMLLKQALELNPAHPPALLEQKLVDEASKSAAESAKQQ